MKPSQPPTQMSYWAIVKRTWLLLTFFVLISAVFSGEYINMIFVSKLLWPDEPFHAFQMGGLITVRLWVDGVFALFWGYWVDRVNRKRLWPIILAFLSIFVFANGLLPVGQGDAQYIFWVIDRAGIGMFMSMGGPAIKSFASDLIPRESRSRFFGIQTIVGGCASALFSFISAFVFQLGYWRSYYIVLGLLFFGYCIAFLLIFQEPKRGIQEHSLTDVLTTTEAEYKFTLSKDTLKATVFSKSNLLILAEGVFTNFFFGILDLVLLPYIQDSPRNLSPTNSAILSVIFGLPGSILGALIFGKIADRLGAKNLRHRITMIIISLVGGFGLVIGLFFVQLPHLSVEEGSQVSTLFRYPGYFVFGLIIFISRWDFSLFQVNQPAIIQEINLPETQGQISSWGQLVEIASYGMGPLVAGFLLDNSATNYMQVILNMAWLLLPGLLMWVCTYRTIFPDRKGVEAILKERADILEKSVATTNTEKGQ
jgi:MFS family permease